MYYSLNRVLSYGSFLSFLIGERGCGKTYSVTKWLVGQYIKKGYQFVYMRRYKSDLKKSVPTFFDSLIHNNEFPDHELKVKGNSFYIDGNLAGYAVTLSTVQDLKSSNFDMVKFIMFDEVIIDEGQKKYYLPNECEAFLSGLESILRMKNGRVFLLGNAGNLVTNPYFLYFGMSIPTQSDIRTFKDGLILLQYMKNDEYREAKKQSLIGRLVEGTNYEKYAIENQDTRINSDFIEKKKGTAKFNFAIKYNGLTFGIWFDYNEGKIYVSDDYYHTSYNIFALTTKDHTENTMLMKSINKYNCWKKFIVNYEIGNVRFESQEIKAIFTEIINKIIIHK